MNRTFHTKITDEATADPADFLERLEGWRRTLVEHLRAAVRDAGLADERIKWGNLVYFLNGPVLMIRAEEDRVLFGFWRGKRLIGIEPRLKPGGKYEMATIEFRQGDSISPEVALQLASAALALNESLGDPTRETRSGGANEPGDPIPR